MTRPTVSKIPNRLEGEHVTISVYLCLTAARVEPKHDDGKNRRGGPVKVDVTFSTSMMSDPYLS